MVYAGAFITQVGQYNRATSDRVSLYRRVQAIEHQVEDKVKGASDLARQLEQRVDKELDSLRRLQRAEVAIN